jgi:type IV secretory pathway VirB6-like protein
MTPDWVNQLNSIVLGVITSQKNLFQSYGTAVWLALAAVILCVWGIETAFSGYVDFHSFFKTILLIVTVKALLQAYSVGVPWLPDGRTFPALIIDGPKALAAQLSYATMQLMTDSINKALSEHPPATLAGLGALITYWISWVLIELAQAVMWAVTCFGLVAQAVCVILGPVFIPMLLVKPFAFLFWGWLKSLLQYSFYPLVCACYTYILSTFLTNELVKVFGPDFSLADLGSAMALLPYLIIIILSMLTVPSVVGALFTGGQSTLGSVMQMAAWTRLATKGGK